MRVFSHAIKLQMRATILSVMWPKKSIYAFFKDSSISIHVLKRIDAFETSGISRAAMIDEVFTALRDQPDNGTMQFDQMLEVLSSWTYFDPFWFEAQQKLDRKEAERHISALRKAKDENVDVTRKRIGTQREKEALAQERHASLEEMRADFQIVSRGSATLQARGIAFERSLARMARYFDLQVTDSFRIKGTQIDGSIKYDGEHYSIEAKWHDRRISDEPLLAFCHKQEGNMQGRGLFISIQGFMEGALHTLERSHIKNTILVDGEDIALILQGLVSLPVVLDKKIQAAQTRGLFYVHPITGVSKITR